MDLIGLPGQLFGKIITLFLVVLFYGAVLAALVSCVWWARHAFSLHPKSVKFAVIVGLLLFVLNFTIKGIPIPLKWGFLFNSGGAAAQAAMNRIMIFDACVCFGAFSFLTMLYDSNKKQQAFDLQQKESA